MSGRRGRIGGLPAVTTQLNRFSFPVPFSLLLLCCAAVMTPCCARPLKPSKQNKCSYAKIHKLLASTYYYTTCPSTSLLSSPPAGAPLALTSSSTALANAMASSTWKEFRCCAGSADMVTDERLPPRPVRPRPPFADESRCRRSAGVTGDDAAKRSVEEVKWTRSEEWREHVMDQEPKTEAQYEHGL